MGFLWAFLSAVFYTLSAIFMKKGMNLTKNDNGIITTLVINIIVLGMIWFFVYLSGHKTAAPTIPGVLLFTLAGVLTAFLGRSMFFIGIRSIGSSRAAGIKNSSPVFTIFFAVVVLNESITGLPWLGIAFIFMGLIYQGFIFFTQENTRANKIGYIITLGSALGFGIGQAVRKQAIIFYDNPFAGAFIGAVVGFVSAFIIAYWKKRNITEILKTNVNIRNKFYILGGLSTSFALLSFFIAVQKINVAYVGAILAIEPILTVLLSRIFLKQDESITLHLIGCAALIFVGAGIISLTG
ncbi:DMT family transporter [Alteribacillus sp. YIM 98480]|uniref:DMT family transporter n=1 Tax=Alteribacillus sp. YIM 98480 TaxID=2606599 RepID=UPI00131DCC9B|nr:EamA family transporter [Alteribacillus sp. YIM 98480]